MAMKDIGTTLAFMERDDEFAGRVSAELMDFLMRLGEARNLSMRELSICTGLSQHLLCDRGRNIQLFNLIHLCRFLMYATRLSIRFGALQRQVELAVRHHSDLVVSVHPPSDDALPPDAERVLTHG